MGWQVRSLIATIAAVTMCLWTVGLPVEAQAQSTASQPITVEQAYTAFSAAGYQVDPIVNWGWLSPSMSTFVVHDPLSERVLMVLVFPDAATAGVFRAQMAAHFQSEATDPYVIAGYGPSMWNGNVGLVESTESQLARVGELQAEQNRGMYVDVRLTSDLSAPDIRVDVDFQQALHNGAANI